MNLSKRLMPEYIRLSSWLMIFMFFLFPLKNILSQDKVYNAPDVSIFSEPEQVLNYLELVITLDLKDYKNIIFQT